MIKVKKGLLPDKPSELVALALKDLRAVEKNPRYAVYMGDWHCPSDGHCCVCFAEAVMANTLKISPCENVNPEDFSSKHFKKLHALNMFRSGSLCEGLSQLGIQKSEHNIVNRPKYDYSIDRTVFKAEMVKIIRILRKNGF